VAASRALGLRLQIVLALAGLMLLAFVPLFYAVAGLTRATLSSTREAAARSIGRAVGIHIAFAYGSRDPDAVRRAFAAQAGRDGAEAVRVFDEAGAELAVAGPKEVAGAIEPPDLPAREVARTVHDARGAALDVVMPQGSVIAVTRVRLDDAGEPSPILVRLVALYMITFAFALLVFAYFALTRLIVRPVDRLVHAADRVASGARDLSVPRPGARELAELAESVEAMARRLLEEEAKLRAKVDELTHTTTRLTEARAHLVRSERMASVGRLAAGVAHEIGNPIAAIMGMEELLLAGDLAESEPQDFLKRMQQETLRIHTVLRDMLDFARPERPAPSGEKAPPADVGECVAQVVALLKPQKAFKALALSADVPKGLQVVLPAARLTQVLLNLMMNAGDAVAAKREARVTVRARREEGGRVRVEVEDDGPGVPEPIRDRLFEPFVTTKDVGVGTGLGLAVCRGLVESAGGEISLDATYTAGARFVVVLPEPSAA